jgi:predicted  nucleic acid-binding Zn-ribbon protein
MSQRDDYVKAMKHQLDELNASMGTMEARLHTVKADMKSAYEDELTRMRHQSSLAVDKLTQLGTATEETWGAMVTEMDKVRDAFVHSFSYFKSQV